MIILITSVARDPGALLLFFQGFYANFRLQSATSFFPTCDFYSIHFGAVTMSTYRTSSLPK